MNVNVTGGLAFGCPLCGETIRVGVKVGSQTKQPYGVTLEVVPDMDDVSEHMKREHEA